jgi:hypothetical protein
MSSYLTEDEIEALQTSGLHTKTPYLIQGVRQSQLSIARFSGSCQFNGDHFTYLPDTDELIRDDVRKFIAKRRKKESATSKEGE